MNPMIASFCLVALAASFAIEATAASSFSVENCIDRCGMLYPTDDMPTSIRRASCRADCGKYKWPAAFSPDDENQNFENYIKARCEGCAPEFVKKVSADGGACLSDDGTLAPSQFRDALRQHGNSIPALSAGRSDSWHKDACEAYRSYESAKKKRAKKKCPESADPAVGV